MPEYLAPGVYIEEFESGVRPIEGVGTSTLGILGRTERGPVEPRLVTSFPQFQRLYGSYMKNSQTAYAVEGFFKNGGSRCYVGRIASKEDKTSELELPSPGNTPVLRIKAIGPGAWGDRLAVAIKKAGSIEVSSPPVETDLFRIEIGYFKTGDLQQDPTRSEVYDDLVLSKESPDSIEKAINDISAFVKVEVLGNPGDRPDNTNGWLSFAASPPLTDTDPDISDYEGREIEDGKRSGLRGFEQIDEIALVCAPNQNLDKDDNLTMANQVADKLISHCEKMNTRFAILAFDEKSVPIATLKKRPRPSQYAAVYFPWIYILDPVTQVPKLITPVGHIAGIYARSDNERGVHKAPANEVVKGAAKLEFQLVRAEQASLNPRGINVIRSFEGRGIRVWGARTMATNSLWKYINVRRLFIFLEHSIFNGTQWVVFEPNDEKLWARVSATITAFLTTVWRNGALMGNTPDQAFYVKADRSTMSQDDILNGRLIVEIGVAPVRPAEFVIFRITQMTGEPQ